MESNEISPRQQNGVSGIMRVKNDAEFIKACVYSCIDALDELIIVYNDCTDESPKIIEEIANEFPAKIRVFEYKPQIYAWKLTDEEIEKIISCEIPEENTLYGYYNFALSKTTQSYVMKIDADQIYFPNKLKELCDAYRYNKTYKCPISSYYYVLKTNIRLKISEKYGINIFRKKETLSQWNKYYNNLLKIIRHNKPNISLFGLNTFIRGNRIYVSLGGETSDGVSILGPYNGGGDHPIFKKTINTFFIPYVDKAYNKLNNLSKSVIERLVGISPLLIGGICWIHLNAYRAKTRDRMNKCIEKHPDSFVEIENIRNLIMESPHEVRINKPDTFKMIIDELDSDMINMINKLIRANNL